MKKLSIMIICLLTIITGVSGQKDSIPQPQIRQYWFVLLTEGSNRSQDSVQAEKIQVAHLNNIKKLYMEGKIKVAGPFGEEGDPLTAGWQGLFIFDCSTKEEVEKLLKTDPAVSSGRLSYHIKPWYTVPIGSFEPGKPKAPLF